MDGITKYSMPDDLKKSTLLQLLGQQGSEWWRGQIQELNITAACNFLRGQCLMNKHNNKCVGYTRRNDASSQKSTSVNNLRNIQWDSWKLVPDDAKEMWLNMRLQEKETANGLPKLLWSKLSDRSQKEYLQKWKEFIKDNPNQRNHERNINLVESLRDFLEDDNEDIEPNQDHSQVHSINNARMTMGFIPNIISTVKIGMLISKHPILRKERYPSRMFKLQDHLMQILLNSIQLWIMVLILWLFDMAGMFKWWTNLGG